MRKNRIKYFAPGDLAISYHLSMADSFISELETIDDIESINIILELFNIKRYYDSGIIDRWESSDITKVSEIINSYLRYSSKYELSEIYDNVESTLIEDFWIFYTTYNYLKRIDDVKFKTFIEKSKPRIGELLRESKLVKYYDSIIKEYFIKNPNNITLLVSALEIDDLYTKPLYLPNSLTIDEVNKLVSDYAETERPNLNYLRLLLNIKPCSMVKLTDKIRLKIKRRIESETELFFKNNSGIKTGISVQFDPQQNEAVKVNYDNKVISYSYSMNWLKDNLEYETILNNFIHLFYFVDDQMRITLTSNSNDIKVIEELFSMQSKHYYKIGWEFQHKEIAAQIQLFSYYDFLESKNIMLEDVIEWFYKSYVVDYFNIKNFSIKLPHSESTYIQKCKDIAPEIEGVLKKFNLYVEDNEIDTELYELSSNPLVFNDCKSLLEKKYIYPNCEDFKRVCYYFFSDQCSLHYIDTDSKQYNCFLDVLISRPVYKTDYPDYDQPDLIWLEDNGYLSILNTGQIIVPDVIKIAVIRDLYKHDVINYIHCNEKWKEKIDEMIESDYLRFESSLFSVNEQQYLNYYLNKKYFSNSLELRNMYSHGAYNHSEKDSDRHRLNYITFLILLILITIKINDELCEFDDVKRDR